MTDLSLSLSHPADGSLAEPRDYFDLLKPRVMSLVVFTALAGMLAAPTARSTCGTTPISMR